VIPHPVAGNLADLVRRKAVAVVDEVLQVLTESEEVLVSRYHGRFTRPAGRRLSAESVCSEAVCAVDPTLPR
jgi:hypothetical protein